MARARAIILLGLVQLAELAPDIALVGEDVGVGTERRRGPVERGQRVVVAVLVDQADGLDIGAVARRRRQQRPVGAIDAAGPVPAASGG